MKEKEPQSSKKYNFITSPERSLRMSNIRSKNTRPEIKLRKALWACGIRYRINKKDLPGKPDVVIVKNKIAIFVDGEFWHGFNWEIKKERIQANREYWIPKIERNMERDVRNNLELAEKGYTVLRFWENEINKNIEKCIKLICSLIE